MDKSFYINSNYDSLNFLNQLKKKESNSFYPLKDGITEIGKRLNMGFMSYGLKILYMSGEWDNLTDETKNEYQKSFDSYQRHPYQDFKNYYIDSALMNSYKSSFSILSTKYLAKSVLSIFTKNKYESKEENLFKAVNADNKQTISTMNELNLKYEQKFEYTFSNKTQIITYLDSLDWRFPWSAGAQFSSICTYSNIFELKFEDTLISYSDKLLNAETGSYHYSAVTETRQVINGAMKIITGLDWINAEIHEPKKLIDYCLNNQPYLEGCDIVDFVYVLYKCSNQDNYRRVEVSNLLKDLLNEIKELHYPEQGGFSYYKNKSQTHYYGLKISKGMNTPDLHGTLLCQWAINMILDVLEILPENIKIIKP